MGDVRLLQRAEEVGSFGSDELRGLLEDMRDTMQALNGAGLAAPQIGAGLRVVIFGVQSNSRYPDADSVPETVLINPVITPLDAHGKQVPWKMEMRERLPLPNPLPYTGEGANESLRDFHDDEIEEAWEGCLSLPGLRGLVPRFRNIRYQGLDENGMPIDRTVSGFHARVVQHECDHLDGILYPMRIRDMTQFGYTAELFPGKDVQDE
jgi:peptide deformylase